MAMHAQPRRVGARGGRGGTSWTSGAWTSAGQRCRQRRQYSWCSASAPSRLSAQHHNGWTSCSAALGLQCFIATPPMHPHSRTLDFLQCIDCRWHGRAGQGRATDGQRAEGQRLAPTLYDEGVARMAMGCVDSLRSGTPAGCVGGKLCPIRGWVRAPAVLHLMSCLQVRPSKDPDLITTVRFA